MPSAAANLLIDGFGRVEEHVRSVVSGLEEADLTARLDPDANSIAWLVWHLTRVQDDHVAEVAGTEQVWTGQGWFDRFGLPFDPASTGYAHSSADVGALRGLGTDLLTGYHEAVHERTVAYLADLEDADLDRVVDTSWTPHVTLGVRLVSVLDDATQHAGQAAFVRGVLRRR
ncbi:DUF664 domain-containing protein [Streptomyces sp. DSM 44917]|uniref:DUF664 domain-containing protein n=1 Tax=Streptomyces boetiae TaxID=3075541 RepID=A0ABU2LDD8_9ACTN|nr:DUF664 domain-containing protein [Streptomyces sp. DSM 44917]MDT0309522.1 DUF664 domain-containing protein [Streptomyces sp. DSM 44917]